jgi:hypothetical protein
MLDTVIFDERKLAIVLNETFKSVILAVDEVKEVVNMFVDVTFDVDRCSDNKLVLTKLVIVPFVDCKSVERMDDTVALVPFRLLTVEFSVIKFDDVKLTV